MCKTCETFIELIAMSDKRRRDEKRISNKAAHTGVITANTDGDVPRGTRIRQIKREIESLEKKMSAKKEGGEK